MIVIGRNCPGFVGLAILGIRMVFPAAQLNEKSLKWKREFKTHRNFFTLKAFMSPMFFPSGLLEVAVFVCLEPSPLLQLL